MSQYSKAVVYDMKKIRREQKRRIARRKRMLLLLAIFLGIVLSITLFRGFSSASVVNPSYKYYTSVQIKSGDTLWNVADNYMSDEYHDKNAYIEEVMTLNHMTSAEVYAGEYLTVPYYSTEIK